MFKEVNICESKFIYMWNKDHITLILPCIPHNAPIEYTVYPPHEPSIKLILERSQDDGLDQELIARFHVRSECCTLPLSDNEPWVLCSIMLDTWNIIIRRFRTTHRPSWSTRWILQFRLTASCWRITIDHFQLATDIRDLYT